MRSMRVLGQATWPLALLIGVVATQMLLGLTGAALWLVTQVSDPALPVPAGPPPDLAAGAATLETGLPLALTRAQIWNRGAQLVAASGHVDWPADVPPSTPAEVPHGGSLTFVFAVPDPERPETPLPTYTVKMERSRADIVDEQALVSGIPMPPSVPLLDAYSIPSTRAILLAEENGGTEYRRACALERHISRISLDTTDPARHRWTATYRDDRFPDRNGMLVRIDAMTGEVDGPEMHVPMDAGACEEAALLDQAPRHA